MKQAVSSLAEMILVIQGDGNYEAASMQVSKNAVLSEILKKDLETINNSKIPVDVVFEQGLNILGL